MLLSIVECSLHSKYDDGLSQMIPVKKNSDCVEWVGPVKGPSAASMRNRGAKRATGRWVFFKDPDVEIDLNKLESICRELEQQQPAIQVVSGVYQSPAKGLVERVYSFIQRRWVLHGIEPKRWGGFRQAKKLLGGAMLVHRETFTRMGGFSEEIGWGGEELEFINRVRQQKYLTAVTYRLVVAHKNKLNFWGLLKRAWMQNFNPGRFDFSRNHPESSALAYFRGPVLYWPMITLFLGVGTVANLSGSLLRKWSQLWN